MTDGSATPAGMPAAGPRGLQHALVWLKWPEIGLGAVFLGSALVAIASPRLTANVALIWPSTALAAAILVRLKKVRWAVAAAVILLGGVLANRLGGGDPWLKAIGLGAVNLAEIAAMVWVFRALLPYPFPDITIFQASYITLIMAALVPGCGGLLAAALLHFAYEASFWDTFQRWWEADALGVCVFAPPIILFSRKSLARLSASGPSGRESARNSRQPGDHVSGNQLRAVSIRDSRAGPDDGGVPGGNLRYVHSHPVELSDRRRAVGARCAAGRHGCRRCVRWMACPFWR